MHRSEHSSGTGDQIVGGQDPQNPKVALPAEASLVDGEQDEYLTLTQIGWEWEVSNRVLGKALDEAGYRSYGMPTNKALDEGFAAKRTGGSQTWSRKHVGQFILSNGCTERLEPISRKLYLTTVVVID